jgi:hypothetical protein
MLALIHCRVICLLVLLNKEEVVVISQIHHRLCEDFVALNQPLFRWSQVYGALGNHLLSVVIIALSLG